MTAEPDAAATAAGADAAEAASELDAAALQAEVEDLRARHMRAVADYQNLRRRSEEERQETARLTMAALVINYLPILDDLRRALDSVDADIADHSWVEGVRMVERKFAGVLESAGVKEVEAEGVPFNPLVHEAVSYGPGPEGQVVHLVRPGYSIDGRVIRPATVIVGNGEPVPGAAPNEDGAAPAAANEATTARATDAQQTADPQPAAESGAQAER